MDKLSSYLTFMLGKEKFAANIAHVLHILGVPPITELPNSPDYIRGAINHRGRILTVLDPHSKFGIPKKELTKNSCIVILELENNSQKTEFGILVDMVDQVIEIKNEELLPAPNLGATYKSDNIESIIKQNEEFILVINIQKVFATESAEIN
ncbi:MAG: chemotaxis protein CheW [Bacteroidetes bacterium 4572_77]|nr:MAG: chemotaxis protein CheW [Bacteroidetes bacterium 4572_77]